MGNNSKYIETADWRKRQSAVPSPEPSVGVQSPGFKRQANYTTNSQNGAASGQEAGRVAKTEAPKVDTTAPATGGAQPSDAVTQAQQMLNEHLANRPGAYQSTWQGQVDEILNQILNREKFSYDVNADALYRQMAEQYTMRGQQAMMDTMGQAAALTGGYGNSYALGAGQQAYQGYLQQLSDVMPDLYQMALNNYQMEGDALLDKFGALGAMEDQAYSRFQDDQNVYYTMLDQLLNQYNTERNFAYEQGRDQVADDQWQAEFDEDKRRYDQEWELAVGEYTGQNGNGSSGSGGGSGSGSGGNAARNPSENGTENPDGYTAMEELLDAIVETGQGMGSYGNSAGANTGGPSGGTGDVVTTVDAEIDAAENAGVISEEEADKLRKKYSGKYAKVSFGW